MYGGMSDEMLTSIMAPKFKWFSEVAEQEKMFPAEGYFNVLHGYMLI